MYLGAVGAVGRVGRPGLSGAGAKRPSLSLDFLTPDSLDPRINFTRASSATYTDASGTIQSAAVNVPRWDYDPTTHALRGLLIEEARTNLLNWTGDLNNAVWSKFNNIAAAPITAANQATAPDGTLTAARITYPAVSGAGAYSCQYQGITGTATPYTVSIWLRGSVGGEQTYIEITDNTSYYVSPRLTLTTQWQRFSVTSPALTTTAWYFIIGTDLRGAQTSTPAQSIYAWGGQMEVGGFPTSYIPTTSVAVTRAVDAATISPANMSPWFNTTIGSWFAEFIPFNPTGTNNRIVGYPSPGAPGVLFLNPAPHLSQYDGSGSVDTVSPTIAANVVHKGCSSFAAGVGKACADAGPVATGALSTGYALLASGGVAFLTIAGAGTSTDNTSGYIRRVQYWSRVLSDTEMQQVTT
jgi:hypothetical protein